MKTAIERKLYRIKVSQDLTFDGENPRKEWDNFGTMIHKDMQESEDGRRYNSHRDAIEHILLDVVPDPDEFDDYTLERLSDGEIEEKISKHAILIEGRFPKVLLYVTLQDVMKEYGVVEIDQATFNKALSVLEGEIQTYRLWVDGDVSHLMIEEGNKCPHCGEIKWEYFDGCGGFFGLATNGIKYSGMEEVIPDQPEFHMALGEASHQWDKWIEFEA